MKLLKMIKDKGFTMIELMVVVGIIGILSAIGIPQFQKYQARARTSEAKIGLAGIYTAQISFETEANTYASCIKDMGFDPPGQRFYTIGFRTAFPAGAISGVNCNLSTSAGQNHFLATKSVGGITLPPVGSLTGTAQPGITGSTFEVGAAGAIFIGTVLDKWSIDEDKAMGHDPGY